MKIKTVKKMNLPELIQYVWDEQIKSDYGATQYHSNVNTIVEVDMSGQVSVLGKHYGSEVYTVPVMEELTEDTEFDELWETYWDTEDLTMRTRSVSARINMGDDAVSINGIKSTNGDISKAVAIFYKDTLIWSAEHGIPESGVVEVEGLSLIHI